MEDPNRRAAAKAPPDEPPPVLGTWNRLYAVVIANTLIIYVLLWAFSRYATP